MSDRISRDEKIRCCVLALFAFLILVPASVLSQTETPHFVITTEGGTNDLTFFERSRVRSFINFDALSKDENERSHGLIGMPVRVIVRIQNGKLTYSKENGEEPPKPVAIISNWMDQVAFDVKSPDGTVISNVPTQFLPDMYSWSPNRRSASAEEAVALWLLGNWVIDEAAIACVEGDYVVGARWRGVQCDENLTLTVRAPVGDIENGKIRLAKAQVMHGMGAFDNAIREYDAIIQEHGNAFELFGQWVLECKGDALGAANRLQEAIAVYQECRASMNKKIEDFDHPPRFFDDLAFRIRALEAAILRAKNAPGAK